MSDVEVSSAHPLVPVEAEPRWVCVGCRAWVAMADDVCPTCGRAFGEGLGLTDDPDRTARPTGRWAAIVRDLVVLNVLFVIWRVVGRVSLLHTSGAFSRGRSVWRLERRLHLPSEASLQHGVLAHETLARALNGYYEFAHAPLLALTLVWLMVRHRDVYPRWRNLVVAFTGAALVVGLLPIAPPRLVPGLGMVDLAQRYHQSVYGSLGHGVTDQLSAMPSVHVGWAVLVAAAVISVSRHRMRWLAVAHPVITAYVVIVTANHYWLDGVTALALLGTLLVVGRRVRPGLLP